MKQNIGTKLMVAGMIGLAGIVSGCAGTSANTQGAPYSVNNMQHHLPNGVVEEEDLNAYLRTMNGSKLKVWEIIDAEGNKGIYAFGRGNGMRFKEYATDGAVLSGSLKGGPVLPEGYTANQIR